jgi:drug/metabolite transporter (DMT)-like permease
MVKFQLGVVPPEASIAYRIGIAAICMFIWATLRKASLKFPLKEHFFLALQGSLIFSCNFIFFYWATHYLTTGLIAVVCSTATIWVMIFNTLMLHRPPTLRVMGGAVLGICGIATVFYPELASLTLGSAAGRGLLLSIGGTLCFAMGSIVSQRNQRAGFPAQSNIAWAMFYGMLLLTFFLMLKGQKPVFDFRWSYIASLFYLTFFASVVAFLAYFALLRRVTSERAAYVTVLLPIVALGLSTVFEGYQWSVAALLGVVMILSGNVLVLASPAPLPGKS